MGGQLGENVGKKLGEKVGEKTGEKVGESLGEIHKLNLCQKASKKALTHPMDHVEGSLRPIKATQVTHGPFWTSHKRLKVLGTSNQSLAT